MWLSLGPWPNSQCSKTVQVGCSREGSKPCQREIATDEIQEKKNYRERSNINRTCQCTDWLSATQNVWGAARDSAPSWNQSRVTQLTKTSLNHWAIDLYRFDEKHGTWLVLSQSCNLKMLFCVQDCRSQIAQLEYQGQTRNTRILERKPLIDTSYRIQHRLELKYFHFAQFLLNAHRAAHQPQKSDKW